MRRRERRLRLAIAERRLADATAGLHASTANVRARIHRHGPVALLGGGVAAGAVTGLLPLGGVMRIARGLASVGMLLLRLPVNAWIGALRMHDRSPTEEHAR